MGNLTLLIGLGIVIAILIYMFFRMGEQKDEKGAARHFILQIIILVFVFVGLLLIGKVALDDQDFCAWNVANSTTSGVTTSYEYDYECSDNTNTTAVTFYKALTYFIIIVAFYVLVYVLWEAGKWTRDQLKHRLRRK